MQRLPRSWILAAVLIAAVGSGPAASAGTVGMADSPSLAAPGVKVCGSGASLTRPASMILTCADDGERATHLTWSSWTSTRATATGEVTWRACTSICAMSTRFKSTKADVTLTHPVAEPGQGVLFTQLRLHVTGPAPAGFLRNVIFSEAPVTARPAARGSSPRSAQTGRPAAIDAASGTLGYGAVEGFWHAAGGPAGNVSVAGGTFTQAQIAAAITGAESSFLPGIIQPGVDYCGAGADRAGWGLWQITCGNSVPKFGTNFQILDPWNNAEAAVAKFDAAGGFTPWSTFTSGAYTRFLQHTGIDTAISDPGEYVQVNATPPGTPASPPPAPGSKFGPLFPGGVMTAIQANTGILWTDRNGTATNTGVAMSPDAGPAIASSGGGFEIAVQSANHFLWTDTNGTVTNRELGMAEDTSPAIAALTTSGYEIAFQANTGDLWLVSPSGTATDTKLGMKAGTSPAITATSGGGFEVAFQASTGFLWIYAGGKATNTELGMAPLTSPAITALPAGGREIAFQASTGFLWTDTSGHSANTELGMMADTSPSIADVGGVGDIAFQANTGSLWVDENGHGVNQSLGMSPHASPSITAVNGGFQAAFQANTHFLWGDTDGHGGASTLGMMEDTSPSITALH